MSFGKLNVTLPLGVEVHFSHAAQTTQASQSASISSGETSEVKISRVTSAWPANTAIGATIVDTEVQDKMVMLRGMIPPVGRRQPFCN
jgi:hypothetical protein